MKNEAKERKSNIIAFLLALAFLFNAVCFLVNLLFPSATNFGEYFVFAILVVGIIVCFGSMMKINQKLLYINIAILILIILSRLFYGSLAEIQTLLINYVAWGVGVTIIMMQEYDMHKTLQYGFWIGTIIMTVELFMKTQNSYDPMTWTYAVFPCVAVAVIHFVYCRFEKLWQRAAYIPCICMLVKFVMYANRGGLLSLIILLFFVTIKAVNKKEEGLKSRRAVVIAFFVVLFLATIFFNQIVTLLYNLMLWMDIEISALEKMHRMIQEENVLNNRSGLYEFAWRGFIHSPLWGNGVGGFYVNHGGYAHNFILQILYEGGLLLIGLILIPLIRNCLFVMKEKRLQVEEYALFAMFFTTSIPKLFVSSELWKTQSFWMLFAFAILIKTKYSELEAENTQS